MVLIEYANHWSDKPRQKIKTQLICIRAFFIVLEHLIVVVNH